MTKYNTYYPHEKKASARGYFYDLSHSPYHVNGVRGEKYLFPSEKKREMFLKEYHKRMGSLEILLTRVYILTNQEIEINDEMQLYILNDIYSEMKRKF